MKIALIVILPVAMLVWAWRNLPAPACGWRGGLARLAQSLILAAIVFAAVDTLP